MRLRPGVGGCGGLGGLDCCGLGFGAVGLSGARWHSCWRPSASGLLGIFWTGFGVTFRGAGWLGSGLGGGAAGRGVRRIVLCGARGSWCAPGASVVCALTLAGWRGGLCARVGPWGDVSQAPAFSSRLLEGLLQAPEDIRVVLRHGEVAGVDSQGVERNGQHGFPCGLWHPAPPPAGGGSSPPTPRGAGGPGPRGWALPGPTFAAPRAACGSSAATTVPGRGRGLGGRSGSAWVWWGCGDWWPWRARGISHSPVPWRRVGSGSLGGCEPAGTRTRSLPQGWVVIRDGGGSGASAGCGLTSRV